LLNRCFLGLTWMAGVLATVILGIASLEAWRIGTILCIAVVLAPIAAAPWASRLTG
jgi:hypothetical protein